LKRWIVGIAVLVVLSGGGLAEGDPITYSLVSPMQGFTVTGTITTDGTLGPLSSTDIVGYSWEITDGASSFSSDPFSASDIFVRDLSATATSLSLGYNSSNRLRGDLLLGSSAGPRFLEYYTSTSSYEQTIEYQFGEVGSSSHVDFSEYSGDFVLVPSTPEPAAIVRLISLDAMGLIVFAWQRRRRQA